MYSTYANLFARFLEATREFNVSMGQPDNAPFSEDLMNLRLRLIEEEAKELDYELREAINQVRETGKIERPTAMQIIKESADLVYVLAGTAATFGFRYEPNEVEQIAGVSGSRMSWNVGEARASSLYFSADRTRFFVQCAIEAGKYYVIEKGREPYWLIEAIENATETIIEMADEIRFPLLDAFNAVHASNMSKLGDDGKPVYREDGKVMKGPNYHKPDMSVFVEQEEDD